MRPSGQLHTGAGSPSAGYDAAGCHLSLSRGEGSAEGTPVYLCFQITANDAFVRSQTGTTTWEFSAQSQ